MSACVPKCLRCLMLMLSGPVELFVFDCFMALAVCVMSMFILVDGSFCVYLSIFLLFL